MADDEVSAALHPPAAGSEPDPMVDEDARQLQLIRMAGLDGPAPDGTLGWTMAAGSGRAGGAGSDDAVKGEYRAVAVMACDADVIPNEERLLSATDERALKEVFDTERHLLHVAATRARERLSLTAAMPPSEFIEDLTGQGLANHRFRSSRRFANVTSIDRPGNSGRVSGKTADAVH